MNSLAQPSHAALRAVVAEAYRVFGRHAAPPFPLDVCLSCCVPDEIEQQLRQWPLRRLTAKHLYDYNTSAKSEVQSTAEVGYLLARMLDLLAEGVEIHHSIEISLDRLGRCPAGAWNEKERTVLDRFASAYFECTLRGPLAEGVQRWFADPLSILLMFDIGGLAIDPLLDLWLHCEDPISTVQFVEATYWDFWEGREYCNPFASDRPAFRERLREWLLDSAHNQRFAAKLLTPEFREAAEARPPFGCTAFDTMVDGVFDQLMQQM